MFCQSKCRSVMSDSFRPYGLYSSLYSYFKLTETQVSSTSLLCYLLSGFNMKCYTEVGSVSLLQQIFPTRESNWGLLHYRQILYQLSHQGSRMLLHGLPLTKASWCLPKFINNKTRYLARHIITKLNTCPSFTWTFGWCASVTTYQEAAQGSLMCTYFWEFTLKWGEGKRSFPSSRNATQKRYHDKTVAFHIEAWQ